MRVQYLNDDGDMVEGTLTIGDGRDADEVLRLSPFFRSVVAAEWELIRRYDRGEF